MPEKKTGRPTRSKTKRSGSRAKPKKAKSRLTPKRTRIPKDIRKWASDLHWKVITMVPVARGVELLLRDALNGDNNDEFVDKVESAEFIQERFLTELIAVRRALDNMQIGRLNIADEESASSVDAA